jgi:DNA-binding MarR family transcriptional regulator
VSPEPHDGPSDSIAFLLRQAEAAVRATADRTLAETQLTLSQYFVLRLVRAARESSSAALARRYAVSPRAMTGLLAGLESAGLVSRNDHPSHRRIKLISLTPEGVRRTAAAEVLVDALESDLAPSVGARTIKAWLKQTRG